jgi:arylamine N-acetyltransferase
MKREPNNLLGFRINMGEYAVRCFTAHVWPRWVTPCKHDLQNISLPIVEYLNSYGVSGQITTSPLRNRSTRYAVITLRGLPSSAQARMY